MKLSAFLLVLPALGLLLPSATASAQCPDGALVCAEVHVSGSFSVGARTRRAPPPAPQGQVLVVQPAPPQPQVIVVRQQQPRPIVVRRVQRRRQQQIIVEVEQQPLELELTPIGQGKIGITARLGGIFAENVRMGGFSAGLRFRPSRVFGIELNIGGYGGTDYQGNERVEVPIGFDFMLHLPRASRFQFLILAGVHGSWATISSLDRHSEHEYFYTGVHAGIGGEFRISRRFALSADVRGFVRQRVGGGAPEFTNAETGETTDTSGGLILNIGAHLYF